MEDTDHLSGGSLGAAWATLRLLVTPEPPFVSIDLLKTLLPRLIILFLLINKDKHSMVIEISFF